MPDAPDEVFEPDVRELHPDPAPIYQPHNIGPGSGRPCTHKMIGGYGSLRISRLPKTRVPAIKRAAIEMQELDKAIKYGHFENDETQPKLDDDGVPKQIEKEQAKVEFSY